MQHGLVLLLGGPAGAGKSTLGRAWCERRARAVQLELDRVREQILGGFADPQRGGRRAGEQYDASVEATIAQARVFAAHGYDVAVDDVIEPDPFGRHWRHRLDGADWRLVILLPALEETLARSRSRSKRVMERHIRSQHAACSAWPRARTIDTSGLDIAGSLDLLERRLSGG